MARVNVCLGLGSNMGDRQANLTAALRLLARQITLRMVSSVYETTPWGFEQQACFLNCACVASTELVPPELLNLTQEVEKKLGRVPTFRYGPRMIDVDILLYGRRVHRSQSMEIPHPHLEERAFALVPLAEVAGDVVHPVLRTTIKKLAAQVDGRETVRVWSPPVSLASLLD